MRGDDGNQSGSPGRERKSEPPDGGGGRVVVGDQFQREVGGCVQGANLNGAIMTLCSRGDRAIRVHRARGGGSIKRAKLKT